MFKSGNDSGTVVERGSRRSRTCERIGTACGVSGEGKRASVKEGGNIGGLRDCLEIEHIRYWMREVR